jgi:hypothetical protein
MQADTVSVVGDVYPIPDVEGAHLVASKGFPAGTEQVLSDEVPSQDEEVRGDHFPVPPKLGHSSQPAGRHPVHSGF